MADFIHHLLFGIYPYVALAVLAVGSVIRYDREPYSWRAGSSQLLRRKQLIVGSVLFHLRRADDLCRASRRPADPDCGVRCAGRLARRKQLLAIVAGGFAGVMAITGATLLIHRRFFDPRVRAASSFSRQHDHPAAVGAAGAGAGHDPASAPASRRARDGQVHDLGARHLHLPFRKRADQIRDAALVFKLHLFMGLTILLLFPFTRLVHMLSAPVRYIWRPGYQVVRSRKMAAMNFRTVMVGGREIPAAAIAAEAQHHPAPDAAAAWNAAAEALAVRQLLLDEAERLGLVPGDRCGMPMAVR
jgi:nitrate reductase gamma subunit